MGIPHSRAVKAFLRRCTLSTAAVDLLAFSSMNCFVFFLNAAAWQRVLDELIVSKLLEGGPFTTWVAFLSRLERLEWINSNNLVLLASDLDPGESFDAPAQCEVGYKDIYAAGRRLRRARRERQP
mmetsp:Transcript_42173/g.105028  ORF Transcript_42173/g.105028 Transcript_42173/m.105028 type:complete len:125 (-) Transcript_42173:260-634(-)